uniref:Essential myosin light chain n=1 Tax=Peripatoides novaezealandiae TaxID=49105 RepID=A0A0A7AAG5_9BILA|nr:essential myosin light chain [Peripatoides novaezealandiae]
MADLGDAEVEHAREHFEYDMCAEGQVDALILGDLLRSLKLTPTAKLVEKHGGTKKAGEKKITLEEFMPIYAQVSKEKDQGTYADFMEGLKVYDKAENGTIIAAELRHVLLSLGEKMKEQEMDEIMHLCSNEDSEGNIKYEMFIKKVLAGPFPEEES